MDNAEKLKELLQDVFLLNASEFHFNLKRQDIDTWDSLGVVSMAVGVEEVFGYHFTPEEAMGIESVRDIIEKLEENGISFDDAATKNID